MSALVANPPRPVELNTLDDDDQIFFAPHRRQGRFFNPWNDVPMVGPSAILKWRMGKNPWAAQKKIDQKTKRFPMEADPAATFARVGGPKLLWLGHASFLVEVEGVRMLIDPIFGRAGGVIARQTPAPVVPEDLSPVHAVLLTHGHHDHMDAASLRLCAKLWSPTFVVPVGLGRFLPRIAKAAHTPSDVVELDWWHRVDLALGSGSTEVSFVPAQHWHRRSVNDQNKALWGGFVIRSTSSSAAGRGGGIYHSGDTGFFGGFATIGRVFEGLDTTLLPVAAWEPRWFMKDQHMSPIESVQAFVDLQARRFVAMHWGTFDLTDEPLDYGATVVLPEEIDKRKLDPERFVVLPHGGTVKLG